MATGRRARQAKRRRQKEIGLDLLKGLLFVALLLGAKWGIEQSTAGEQVERMTYNLLQLRLSSQSSKEDPAVAIVDISDLSPTSISLDGWTRQVTPREQLLEMVNAIADQGPSAIGVDIDFSREEKRGYLDPGDPDFFQSCIDIGNRTKVPIYLGIARSQDSPPEQWLGDEKYQDLAASILVPRPDVRRLFKWTRVDGQTKNGTTMSAALAASLEHPLPGWLEWAVRQTSQRRLLTKPVVVGEFLVDYSTVNLLERRRLRTKNPTTIRDEGRLLKGKIVLLGDASRGVQSDNFLVPAQLEPVPGVYLHACGALTLMNPLFELTGEGLLAIDLTISIGIIGAITSIRLYYKNRPSQYVNTQRLQAALALLAAAVALVVGIVFVNATRLMWNDFILVIGAVLLHPSVDRNLGRAWPSIKGAFRRAFRWLIFSK